MINAILNKRKGSDILRMIGKKAHPDRGICVACGVCVGQCPKSAISIYKGCYAVVEANLCVGCGLCAKACPANAICVVEDDSEVTYGK